MTKLKAFKKSNSQAGQDMLVLNLLQEKRDGFYVEIGSSFPVSGNNTCILEQEYNWKGLSLNISPNFVRIFRSIRKNPVICANALTFDFESYFTKNKFPTQIDYLQIDIDPTEANLEVLRKLPLDKYRFSVITFEHDLYKNEKNRNIKEYAEKILEKNKYRKVANNVMVYFAHNSYSGHWVPFEDWWIDSQIFNNNFITPIPEESKFIEIFEYSFQYHLSLKIKILIMKLRLAKKLLVKLKMWKNKIFTFPTEVK